eukprot:Blabericola_migrator_1__1131@NODE_128_length_13299_cov_164_804867_g113_i0_p7_GENE_NODE_128_length_13299_cov_164_804867_g113_i0NODE_128_length_13299_cov_164_804867_g113_i0_p7_ORF_typecomplete_len337_score70_46Wtap/PF17098_5/91Wtap/PF17098_5/1_9e10Wtap/PF17098_5/35HOOK/PF05622_12/1_4e02HOOK/PF05622_12/0_023TSC22/PF01166_18/31TSC22/PF01166_18/6_5e02TSC22/PF01166_18/4_2Sec34/PF04136_15/6_2e02Sec34/PF04136_15/0_15ZapB/PF06005_12/67ZapB/PF06005_12/36ZapB/PF06005_12/2_3HAP1_N/PF04849_13/16HAP1_N/PF0484
MFPARTPLKQEEATWGTPMASYADLAPGQDPMAQPTTWSIPTAGAVSNNEVTFNQTVNIIEPTETEKPTQPAYTHTSEEHLMCHARMAELEMENMRLKTQLCNGISPLLTVMEFGEGCVSDTSPSDVSSALCQKGDQVLIDPAVAQEMIALKVRLGIAEEELKKTKGDFSIMTSFASEGPLGKRLLEKCRKLLKENEQLGECVIASKVAKRDQHELFTDEKIKFLMSQLKQLYELNSDLEGECSALSKAINKLAVICSNLRADLERSEAHAADLQRRLERHDRDRSLTTTSRMVASERARPTHRHSPPRRPRDHSPSYDKPSSSRDVGERGRRGGR